MRLTVAKNMNDRRPTQYSEGNMTHVVDCMYTKIRMKPKHAHEKRKSTQAVQPQNIAVSPDCSVYYVVVIFVCNHPDYCLSVHLSNALLRIGVKYV